MDTRKVSVMIVPRIKLEEDRGLGRAGSCVDRDVEGSPLLARSCTITAAAVCRLIGVRRYRPGGRGRCGEVLSLSASCECT